MKYGLALPTGKERGDPTFLVELAVLAEATGWDGVFLEDYICFQGDTRAPTCDPWIALAGIAIKTARVRLGSMVTPLSRRRPWKVAREVAGIDLLSGGRMVLGVGLGDTGEHVVGDSSFTAFGETRNPRLRAEMLD
jgi:alkanesulfonate monooxygenase SsuD/methylene tetrahydromethanopterin reductase-like flavin-dependent oxidoreductase (luciferase family)